MTNKFETVKRVANVGERILITDSAAFSYGNGEVFTVKEIVNDVVKVFGHDVPIYPFEYEVIIDRVEIPKSDVKDQISELLDKLYREGYAEGYRQGKFDAGMDLLHFPKRETPQQARDRIVEQAKADLENVKSEWNVRDDIPGGKMRYIHGIKVCTEEFIVNKEKRTVVCLLRWDYDNSIVSRGIAKCAPGDCFNVHIGKAIALRRALGLEVPDEYLNAPQPTEVRVGDKVRIYYAGEYVPSGFFEADILSIGELYGEPLYTLPNDEYTSMDFSNGDKVIDDSREGVTQ